MLSFFAPAPQHPFVEETACSPCNGFKAKSRRNKDTFYPKMHQITRRSSAFTSALLLGLACSHAIATTFQWNNVTGPWSSPASWQGGVAPIGADFTDILSFGGDSGTTAGSPPHYTATNDIAAVPFFLNALSLNATDAAGLPTDPPLILSGNALSLGGVNPEILQNGAGAFTVNTPLHISKSLHLGGSGTGAVTFNRGISGLGTIVKDGTSVFRFGTFPPPPVAPAVTSSAPSENSWFGPLQINGGIVRFNNNADSGRTAIRANPVALAAGASLTCSSELRIGTLSGTGGFLESQVAGTNSDTDDIVISAFTSSTYGGTLRLGIPTGTGNDLGALVVRGPGTQTLTGSLNLSKDVNVGGHLVLDSAASLSAQTTGAIVMNGGTFRLENSTTNSNNRLRDGDALSTGLDSIGGGLFQLSGHPGGTTETIGRIQLSSLAGAVNNHRSGQLSFQIVHRAGSGAATVLTAASYQRDATVTRANATVEFSAIDGAGAPLNLGSAGLTPRIIFSTAPVLASSLLSSSAGTGSTGWATVQKTDGIAFATHSAANGIAPVTTTTLVPGTTGATINSELTTSASITLAAYAQSSIRLRPSSAGLSLTLGAATTLNTTALALAGANDFTITGGTLGGGGPRFLTIEKATLTLASGLANAQPLVKSGAGTLVLTKTTNNADQQPTVLNNGALHATPGTTLPNGELRFRGGVLGIVGGGTFARPFIISGAPGPGTVNWSGLKFVSPTLSTIPEERGSGGFAAIDADATIDLGAAGVSNLLWEEKGFVQSGFALVLGSPRAAAKITLTDNLSLSSGEANINYNAREIRVPDNAASTLDRARITGVVSGSIHNDLLKTGDGILELTATNTFTGAVIVQAGTLVLSGSSDAAIATDVMNGATLAGTGSTTAILLENGGKLSPGDGTTGTLTASSLTWRAGGIARFDLGAANASDQLALGDGDFQKGTTSGSFAFDFGGTGASDQTYTLATFGSTSFSAADFTATNLAAGVTGHFVLSGTSLIFSTVTPPIDTWRVTYFGAGAGNSGNSADAADPDFDGLNNLAEYVLGGNPTLPSASVTPGYSLPAGTGALTFTRNLLATDVALRIEARDFLTLGNWQTIATLGIGEANWSTIPGVSVTENGTGGVIANDSVGPATQNQRFLRLAIDHP